MRHVSLGQIIYPDRPAAKNLNQVCPQLAGRRRGVESNQVQFKSPLKQVEGNLKQVIVNLKQL